MARSDDIDEDFDDEDDIDLERFIDQQNEAFQGGDGLSIYDQALSELKAGRKRSHWMWFVFPQCDGVTDYHGRKPSEMTVWFGIAGVHEATAYAADETLGPRLVECFRACLDGAERDPVKIFGETDAAKLCACATLFEKTPGADGVFAEALEVFFGGTRCEATLSITSKS